MAVFSILSFVVLFILHVLPNCGSPQNFSTPESTLYDPTSSTPSSGSGNSNNSRLLAAPDSNFIYLDGKGHNGQLLLKLELGTPVQSVWVIVSTTTSLSWVMCSTCETCDKLTLTTELFNPRGSTTYKTVPCISNTCESIRSVPCSDDQAICSYEQPYVSHLTATGLLSKETLHFHQGSDDEVIVQDVLFGCTHIINGEKPEDVILPSGYFGLNNHNVLSVVNQFYHLYGIILHKFSICVTSEGYSSRIYFGNTPPMRSTTAFLHIGTDSLYYVSLWMIKVNFGSRTLEIDVDSSNFIIDSASPVTFIEHNLMRSLSKKILDGIGRNLDRVPVPEFLPPFINFCFDWRKPNATVVPVISFHLLNTAVISGKEAFVDIGNNILCLFIASAKHNNGVQKFGGSVIRDHRLEFDLKKHVVNIQAGHSGRCQPL